MRRLSISTRLALWYGLSLTLLLGLVVTFLYTGFHLTLHRDFDADLAREAERLASAFPPTEAATSGEDAEPSGDPKPSGVPLGFAQAAEASPHAVRLFTPDGSVRYANGRLPGAPLHPPPREEAAYHTHGADDVRTRYEPVRDARGAVRAWVAVAGMESGLHREMHRLGWLLVVGVLLGVVVAALSGYGLARRALRPVVGLAAAANRIGPGARGSRLPLEAAPHDEIGDLAAAFNALLARLDDAFERERRFRADAAHELLTPVTAARSEVDVALRRDRDAEGYRTALRTIGGHVERMAGLVTDLLALSRAEVEPRVSGGASAEALDLGTVTDEAADRLEPVAAAKGVALVRELPGGVFVPAPASDVETVLANLIDNAVKYTPPGGTVTVSVRAEDDAAVASVVDTGVGFAEAERDRLFERFYRADDPAVRGESGNGLGLAIAERLAERNDGRIRAASDGPGRGSVFELRLPRSG